ncbi:hypothetical protein 1 [Hubei sobemo-like virus 16]|uniref:hypothetical protein 1 n=1 Tax=Hubei sobemo-like virus 16 TaxID=1923201 RepID=UPI00090CBD50|nr:hypothetical protein 1 [Hubei sobemo-like virus 16]APG75905.1 hypothetical protein 1 [Hubei sobemo-like virus 16]
MPTVSIRLPSLMDVALLVVGTLYLWMSWGVMTAPNAPAGVVGQNILTIVVFGFLYLRTGFASSGRKVVHQVAKSVSVLESTIPGSHIMEVDFKNRSLPKCQTVVYQETEDGEYHLLGNVVRIGDFLVMPRHIADVAKELYIAERENFDSVHQVKRDRWEDLATDLVYMRASADLLSTLQLSKASIGQLTTGIVASISTAAPSEDKLLYSCGVARPSKDIFGLVEYKGSTRGGFSGAGLFVGTQLIGIHYQGTPSVNFSYEASYVKAMLPREEASDWETAQWLEDIISKKGKLKAMRDPSDPSDWLVYAGGKYHRIEGDVMSKYEDYVDFGYDEPVARREMREYDAPHYSNQDFRVPPGLGNQEASHAQPVCKNLEQLNILREDADNAKQEIDDLANVVDEVLHAQKATVGSLEELKKQQQELKALLRKLTQLPPTKEKGVKIHSVEEQLNSNKGEIKKLANVPASSKSPKKTKTKRTHQDLIQNLSPEQIQAVCVINSNPELFRVTQAALNNGEVMQAILSRLSQGRNSISTSSS